MSNFYRIYSSIACFGIIGLIICIIVIANPLSSQQNEILSYLNEHKSSKLVVLKSQHSEKNFELYPHRALYPISSTNKKKPKVKNTNEKNTLHTVVLIHRHGDRNPVTVGPKDPNQDWPDGLGQLTTVGKQRMYRVGQFVRNRYRDFLTDNPLETYVRSADTDRCVASAELILSGMYEPTGHYIWNPSLKWQPIPVHSVPAQIDSLLETEESCPRIQTELKLLQTTDRVKALMAKMKKIIDLAKSDLGINVETFDQLSWLYNDLKCEYEQQRPTPKWYDDDTRKLLNDAAVEAFDLHTSTDLLKKLFSGPLLADILYRFANNDTVNEKNVILMKKFFQYSTHDTEVATTLSTLGIWDHQMPQYGSSIFFELHKINEQKIVKLFYLWDAEKMEIREISLPCNSTSITSSAPKNNNDTLCTLEQFQKLVKQFQLPDWNETCFQPSSSHVASNNSTHIDGNNLIKY